MVENIPAANPHADSPGNPAVWYFYAPGALDAPGRSWSPPRLAFPSQATTAREFLAELAEHKLQTIRQRVREHPEQTWEGAARSLHGDMPLPPIPAPPFDPRCPSRCPTRTSRPSGVWAPGASFAAARASTEIMLRLRHPHAAPIKSVTINGRDSQAFDAARELVRLSQGTGKVAVTVRYRRSCTSHGSPEPRGGSDGASLTAPARAMTILQLRRPVGLLDSTH